MGTPIQGIQEALTFDDVLLVPQYSTVLPREVNTVTHLTRSITLNIPIVSAAMDTVTEARLAIAMAQEGGIGIVHKNMSVERQAHEVYQVKKFESGVIKDPITISPDATVQELIALTQRHRISGVPVVLGKALVGIVTSRDLRFETNLNQSLSNIMTPQSRLVTVLEGRYTREDVLNLLHQHRIEKILIVNERGELTGLVTVKDIQKAKEKPLACKDEQGRLRVGASVGVGEDTQARVEALIQAEVDVIVMDTAHGHSRGVLDRLGWLKTRYPQVQIIVGNIVTGEAALALQVAGADAVKVGIGPGSICTTRVIAGVGMPQISAIQQVAAALKGSGVGVIADGGIRYSGDVVKAIAAGADCVMLGGLLAGTEEAPGEVELYQGRSYKSYRGMGSLGAMTGDHGSSDRYFQDHVNITDKLVPEGIEGRVPYKGSAMVILNQLVGGLRSGMGYAGSANIAALQNNTQMVRITGAGMRESHVHDVTITKEPPNYQGVVD
jgi:IMP dehydrogenase